MAFTSYTPQGPYTDNVTPPGVSALLINNIETFLQQIVAPLVADSHISADGNGVATVLSLKLTKGSITRISIFSGSATNAGNSQAHGLGATPDICLLVENQSSPDNCAFVWDKAGSNSTNVKVWTNFATARNYVALAIKL